MLDYRAILAAAFDVLPPFLGAMVVATIVAVVVSTADSYLLAPSTSIVRDIYQRWMRPRAANRELIFASYFATLSLVVVGFTMGVSTPSAAAVPMMTHFCLRGSSVAHQFFNLSIDVT